MSDRTDPKPGKRPGANEIRPPDPALATLTIGEAAYLLRVGVTTVRRLVDAGELPFIAVGGRMLIGRGAVERFLQAAEARRPPAAEVQARVEESARLQAQLRRVRVEADWNTGEDTYGVMREPKIRPRKPATRPGPEADIDRRKP